MALFPLPLIPDVYKRQTFHSSKKEQAYRQDQARRIRVAREIEALESKAYPTRLSPFPSDEKREWIGSVHYIRHYSVWSVIMIFFTLASVSYTHLRLSRRELLASRFAP